jgi:hypothetical protein
LLSVEKFITYNPIGGFSYAEQLLTLLCKARNSAELAVGLTASNARLMEQAIFNHYSLHSQASLKADIRINLLTGVMSYRQSSPSTLKVSR